MSSQELGPAVVMFFHDLFTVTWVGGLITLGVVVAPSARKALGRGPEMQRLMSTIQARLRWFVYVSIAGLVLTGILLSRRSEEFQGFFSWGDTYSAALSVKHVVVLAMIVVALARSLLLSHSAPGSRGPGLKPHGDAAKTNGLAGDSLVPGPSSAEGVPGPKPHLPVAARASMVLLYVNVVFGVAVLFLSALTAAV